MVTGATIQDAFSLSMVMLMIYTMFQEGGMLSVVKRITWRWPWWINKPLHDCLKCMTLWYGLLWVTLFGDNYLMVFVAVGINVITDKIVNDGPDSYPGAGE